MTRLTVTEDAPRRRVFRFVTAEPLTVARGRGFLAGRGLQPGDVVQYVAGEPGLRFAVQCQVTSASEHEVVTQDMSILPVGAGEH